MSIKYQDLISVVRKHTKTKTLARKIVDDLLSSITFSLLEGEKVYLLGVCNMQVVKTKATNRTNPRTGEPLSMPERKRIRFRASSEILNAVNQ